MLLICEGLSFLAGLIIIIVGKARIYGNKTIQGTRARLIGLILMIPGPLAVCMGFFVGLGGGLTQENVAILTGIETLIVAGAWITALIIALTAPETPKAAPYPIQYPAQPQMLGTPPGTEINQAPAQPQILRTPSVAEIYQPPAQVQGYATYPGGTPAANPPKKNYTVWIIVVIAVLLVCCCLTLVVGYFLLQYRVEDVFEEIESSLETFILPFSVKYAGILWGNAVDLL
jgi:hypothetical protein